MKNIQALFQSIIGVSKIRRAASMLLVLSLCSGMAFSDDKPSGLRIVVPSTSEPTEPVPTANPVPPGPIVPPSDPSSMYDSVTASRTSGVAPLSVHFSANFSGSPEEARAFHFYDYTWDFGDPSSGVWSTTGKSKNTAKGGVTAHVFEYPGNYQVTLTVRERAGVIDTQTFNISVQDPDEYYAGTLTTCVNPVGDSNFSGAPSGARHINTDNLSSITPYAAAGNRILFKRGASWTTGGLNWPNNAGPVTIGAYGSGAKPEISVQNGTFFNVSYKQDWRIMDLSLRDLDKNASAIGGVTGCQSVTIFRLDTEGFATPIGWSHWNDSQIIPIDLMSIVECKVQNAGDNGVYVGSENLAFLGNIVANVDDSHVVRIWQGYKGVVSNNLLSGSSISSVTGRHALKLHSPDPSETRISPRPNTSDLRYRTDFAVVSDNVFGSSGPWPVVIGPADGNQGSELSNVVFERNRILTQYGTMSVSNVQLSLLVSGRYHTIRNNIIDGTGSSSGYTAISVTNRGVEPAPFMVEIYNNTIYQSDNYNGNGIVGINIGSTARSIHVMNNLASYPSSGSTPITFIDDLSGVANYSGNLMSPTVAFINANASNPLDRDFRLSSGTVGVNQGVDVPVLEDYDGVYRPIGTFDVGAFEQ